MAYFLWGPQHQLTDNSGNPLSYAKIYVYDSGTTTLRNSYSTIADAIAKTNANTNPVIADVNGRVNLVLAGSAKIVVKDSTATTTYFTVDNINERTSFLDANGNRWLTATSTASAVNYVKIINAATGNKPTIDTGGGDASPELTIQAAGGVSNVNITKLAATNAALTTPTLTSPTMTGATIGAASPLTVDGGASTVGELRLKEYTGNGTNYVGFKAATSLASNVVWQLPNADGSTVDQAMVWTSAGTLGWSSIRLAAASQSQQETPTDNNACVTPAVQQYHPSALKMWAKVNYSGGTEAAYNLTSITDNGTGDTTFTIATDFSSVGYSFAATTEQGVGTPTYCSIAGGGIATGSIRVGTFNAAGTATDSATLSIMCTGDQ